MKQIKDHGICWFCDCKCEEKWYWHPHCVKKFCKENS